MSNKPEKRLIPDSVSKKGNVDKTWDEAFKEVLEWVRTGETKEHLEWKLLETQPRFELN